MKKILLSCLVCLFISSCVCNRKKDDKDDISISLPTKVDTGLRTPTIKKADDDTGRFMKAKSTVLQPPTIDTISLR